MSDTPQNTRRDGAAGPSGTGLSQSGDLSGISEMFGLRDGQQAESGTRTGTDTVGRWVAATEGADQPPDVSSRLLHGRYRLIAELGVGGMGVTYRAWDTQAGLPVVVKMPRREVRSDSEAMQRFAREIDAMLAVPHDSIVPITDHGDDDGCPFVVMRFLPGGSLADYRRRDEAGNAIRNPPGMLHFWLPGVAAALDHIHAKGMLHRDVKPGNIFLDGFLKPYLGDFGIAKVVDESGGLQKEQTLTATKMAVGTPEYMAPELFKPRSKPDGRVDQYALAVTVYEMLCGEKPFKGDRAHIIVEHSAMPVPPLAAKVQGLPQSLCIAVEKGLAKNAADRFTTCREFAAAVVAELAVLEPEPDTVRLLCPSCKNILKLPQKAAGRTGKCPRCQAAMDVAADLGSLWLEAEKRGGGASGKVQAGAAPETPLEEVAVSTRQRRRGVMEWAAVAGATWLGLCVGYPCGVSVNTAKAQREVRVAEAFWQSERAKLSKEKELLVQQNWQLETERDELLKAKAVWQSERAKLVKSEELLTGQNRQRDTARDELRTSQEAFNGWEWDKEDDKRFKLMPASVRVAVGKALAGAAVDKGCVVTGRVLDENGGPATGEIFVTEGNGRSLSRTMDGGWFVHALKQCDRKANPVTLLAGGFSHEITTFTVPITVGKVTITDCVVRRPAPDSLCKIRGRITDKNGDPIANADVSLGSDLTGGWSVGPRPKTDRDGNYEISNLVSRQYTVSANVYLTYESDWRTVTPRVGETVEVPFVLIKPQKVTLDYVFQPDESRAFDSDNVQSGELVFRRPNFGFLFAEGRAHNEGGVHDDLRLESKDGKLLFRNFMCNGSNGFYDAGIVDFQSIKEAGHEKYATHAVPCLVGHVYVVRTYKGRYAKFVVRSIEDDLLRK